MDYSTATMALLANMFQLLEKVESGLNPTGELGWQRLLSLVAEFFLQEVSPTADFEFERRLENDVSELAWQIVEWTYNRLGSKKTSDEPTCSLRSDTPRRVPVTQPFGAFPGER